MPQCILYYIKTEKTELVLRITGHENREYYEGSIKWLPELLALGIPVPKIIKHGQYEDVYYTFISFIKGIDIGEIYYTLKDSEKLEIVQELITIQKKTAALTTKGLYGYPYSGNNQSFTTWNEYLKSSIERSFRRIKQNNIFNINVCEKVTEILTKFNEYFKNVKPIAFLDDITSKNVLIYNGKLSGIVDIDEICFGDSLLVVGLTNMALLSIKADTKYIDYWLEELKAGEIQKKVVLFYTLIFCIDFMGEQGMQFNNDKIVTHDQDKVKLLNSIYNDLINKLK